MRRCARFPTSLSSLQSSEALQNSPAAPHPSHRHSNPSAVYNTALPISKLWKYGCCVIAYVAAVHTTVTSSPTCVINLLLWYHRAASTASPAYTVTSPIHYCHTLLEPTSHPNSHSTSIPLAIQTVDPQVHEAEPALIQLLTTVTNVIISSPSPPAST